MKPESTLTFDAVSDAVKKLAHWLPVTDEMLQDVSAMAGYINARLIRGLRITEDDQLLNGSGSGANIQGVLNRSGLAAAQPRGSDSNADAVLKQIAAITTATNIPPTGIVMNPANWLSIQLAKDLEGQYFGDGPFSRPQRPTLWGLPVAITTAISSGTALVGAFQTASQVFHFGGLRVEASNSHSDFFTKNLVAIRAEQREALCVYVPAAFGTVTGLVQRQSRRGKWSGGVPAAVRGNPVTAAVFTRQAVFHARENDERSNDRGALSSAVGTLDRAKGRELRTVGPARALVRRSSDDLRPARTLQPSARVNSLPCSLMN